MKDESHLKSFAASSCALAEHKNLNIQGQNTAEILCNVFLNGFKR